MSLFIGVVMDPISMINPVKDTTLGLLVSAQARGHRLAYMEQSSLYLNHGEARAKVTELVVKAEMNDWFEFGDSADLSLSEFDAILMRKDPPFDMEFVYTTQLLEVAERQGTLIVNRCSSLRDCNEKLFATQFPQCCPPLVVLETLTNQGTVSIMGQQFLPDIKGGDKRILMINGEPAPYCLARLPTAGEHRGNLAAGGTGEVRALTERDRWIATEVGPSLRERGLLFVGLDVIGDYLTEINVTSPTCMREIDRAENTQIAEQVIASIEQHCGQPAHH